MKLYFLRHGQTDWNAQRKIQGKVEVPLNETGIAQAYAAKAEIDKLPIDICYTSPLSRALDTAKIVIEGRNVPIEQEERIAERGYGDFEGVSYEEADALGLRIWHSTPVDVPNGETMDEVFIRVSAFLDEIRAKHPKENVLMVSHGGIARHVKWYFEGKPQDGEPAHRTPNCTIVEYSDESLIDLTNEWNDELSKNRKDFAMRSWIDLKYIWKLIKRTF